MTPAARAVLQAQVEASERRIWDYRSRIARAELESDWELVRDLGGRLAILEADHRLMLRELRGREG